MQLKIIISIYLYLFTACGNNRDTFVSSRSFELLITV